jgi:hypothetical protein
MFCIELKSLDSLDTKREAMSFNTTSDLLFWWYKYPISLNFLKNVFAESLTAIGGLFIE